MRSIIFCTCLLFLLVKGHADPSLNSFVSCIYEYESRTVASVVNEEKIDLLRQQKLYYPTLQASVVGAKDLINGERNPQPTNMEVNLSMNIYSASRSHRVQAQEHRIKASEIQDSFAGLSASGDRLDKVFQYLSLKNEQSLLQERKKEQRKIKEMLEALVRSKVIDGVQPLLANLTMQQIDLRSVEVDMLVSRLKQELSEQRIYDPSWDNIGFWENLFTGEAIPTSLSTALEKQEMTELLRSEQAEAEAKKYAWLPSLTASLGYQQNLDHLDAVAFDNQMIGAVTLTVPLDELFGSKSELSLRRAQAFRIQAIGERKVADNLRAQKQDLDEARSIELSEKILKEGVADAARARQGLLAKLKYNRADYSELSLLEEQKFSLEKSLIDKKVQRWQTVARSRLKSLVAAGQISCKQQ